MCGTVLTSLRSGGHVQTSPDGREPTNSADGEPTLRETFDALLNPHVLLDPVRDDEGRIVDFVHTEANEAACLYNRCSRDELIGTRLLAMNLMPASRAALMVETLAQVLAAGEPLTRQDVPSSLDWAGDDTVRYLEFHAAKLGSSLLFSWQDVSLAHHLTASLAESERHYRLLAENASDVVVKVGLDGTYTWASPSITEMLGWAPEEWIGRPTTDMTHPEDLQKFVAERSALVAGELKVDHGAWIGRYRAPAKDGTWHWIETHTRRALDDDGRPDGAVVSFRVIDRDVEREGQLERRATYDDLTGALKRAGAMTRLGDISSRPHESGSATAVLFADVDGFKEVNDVWGHVAGDALLRTLSTRLRGVMRGTDSVARIGGDEFLIILEGIHDVAEAVTMAERMCVVARDPVPIPGGVVSITISMGVTLVAPGESADSVVHRSDSAMYAAKRGGRNRVVAVLAGDVA